MGVGPVGGGDRGTRNKENKTKQTTREIVFSYISLMFA